MEKHVVLVYEIFASSVENGDFFETPAM